MTVASLGLSVGFSTTGVVGAATGCGVFGAVTGAAGGATTGVGVAPQLIGVEVTGV